MLLDRLLPLLLCDTPLSVGFLLLLLSDEPLLFLIVSCHDRIIALPSEPNMRPDCTTQQEQGDCSRQPDWQTISAKPLAQQVADRG